MLYKFILAHNAAKVTKNICFAKDVDDQSTINRWFKKLCSGCKNLNDQAKLGRPKN